MSALRNIGAILSKEWHHYFGSPIAYVALFGWTLLYGAFFAFLHEGVTAERHQDYRFLFGWLVHVSTP